MRRSWRARSEPGGMRVAAAAVAFLIPLVVYVRTLARAVTFVDSGELCGAAATLGIAHPSGYPLFTLLGHLLSLVPVGTVFFRVGLLSALSTAGASLLIYWVGSGLALQISRQDSPRAHSATAALIWAPLAGAMLFSFSRTVWSQAVVVEVYSLQAFLVMLLVSAGATALVHPSSALVHWPWIAFACGLALTNHLTGVLLVPAVLLFLLFALTARTRRTSRPATRLWQGLGAGILPLTIYLYLPLRAKMLPPVAWDYPESLQRFLVHVTARQYHAALGSRGLRVEELGRFVTRQLPHEATWMLVLLAVLGLLVLLRRTWRIGLITALMAASMVIYNMVYPIRDIDLYYIPILAIAGLWAAVGCGFLAGLISRWRRAAGGAAAALLCLACVFPLADNWTRSDRSDFRLLEDYVRDTLTYLDDSAVLFAGNWDRFSSPCIYVQQVEGVRKDVLVIDMGAIANPSLEKRLSHVRPELAEACRGELRAVAEIARMAERGQSYDIAEGRARFQRLQRTLLERSVELQSTYVTRDLMRHHMLRGYRLAAEGLALRVSSDDEYREFPIPIFDGPGASRTGAPDRTEQELLHEYGLMLRERARYLERHGRMEEALLLARSAEEVSTGGASR